MEYLFSYKKKSKSIETNEEFYLNGRGSFLNGKALNYNSLIYLPLNEILIVLFDDTIIFIDIKTTLIDSMKIIKLDYYSEIYEKLFPKLGKIENTSAEKELKPSKKDKISGKMVK